MRSMTRALFEAVCAHELEVANRVDSLTGQVSPDGEDQESGLVARRLGAQARAQHAACWAVRLTTRRCLDCRAIEAPLNPELVVLWQKRGSNF
jgi:hypothetical protein